MYSLTICYIATRINTMVSGNGLLSLYLTIAAVKDTEKEVLGKYSWKRRNCSIPAFSPFHRCPLPYDRQHSACYI